MSTWGDDVDGEVAENGMQTVALVVDGEGTLGELGVAKVVVVGGEAEKLLAMKRSR